MEVRKQLKLKNYIIHLVIYQKDSEVFATSIAKEALVALVEVRLFWDGFRVDSRPGSP
jgi:hypothetical protein